MINANWLFLIIPGCVVLGMFLQAIFDLGKEADLAARKAEAIREVTELVVEAAIDHGYIEDSRSEGDYDLNVSKEGTEKIRKILEAL